MEVLAYGGPVIGSEPSAEELERRREEFVVWAKAAFDSRRAGIHGLAPSPTRP